MMRAGVLAAAVSLVLCACASGPKKNRVHEFDAVIAEPMRIRRPPGPGADPSVGPGGEDYTARPVPDAAYDCRAPESLYEAARVAEIRACAASITTPLTLTYKLARNAVPTLELFSPEEGSEQRAALPECIRKLLVRLPVPREVFFLAEKPDQEGYQCYSTRLDVESDTPLGVRLPLDRWLMDIQFPLEAPTPDDAAMSRVLVSWSLTPVMKPGGPFDKIRGTAVPEGIFRQCFGDMEIPKRKFPYPPTWP